MKHKAAIVVALCSVFFVNSTPVSEDELGMNDNILVSTMVGADNCAGWDLTVHKAGCVEPLPISNGGICTPTCSRAGYVPSTNELRCNYGRFIPQTFTCIANGCTVPTVDHADPAGVCKENYYPGLIPSGSVCTASCAPGYSAGPSTLTCKEGVLYDGDKATEKFVCKAAVAACPLPPFKKGVVGNSTVSSVPACKEGSKMDLDTVCSVGCADGYTAVNPESNTFKCTFGKLIEPTLSCLGNSCPLPLKFEQGITTGVQLGCEPGTSLGHGQSCSVQCAPGYQITSKGGFTQSYSCNAGSLAKPTLQCAPVLCKFPIKANTHYINCFPGPPTTCNATCDTGFDAPDYDKGVGNMTTLKCDHTTGQVIGRLPTCSLRTCGDLPKFENVTFTKGCKTTYGSSCIANCALGYDGNGNQTFTCGLDGWNGTAPICQAVVCGQNQYVESHVCVDCPPGNFRKAGDMAPFHNTICTACGFNSYRDLTMATCAACPPHTTTNGTLAGASITACRCGPGYYGKVDNLISQCSECPVDTFKSGPGETCTPCPAFSSTNGGTARKSLSDCVCLEGYAGSVVDGVLTCSACAVNTFKDSRGGQACSLCPSNSSTVGRVASNASTDCLCDPGFGPTSFGCGKCPVNTYKSESSLNSCAACPEYSTTKGVVGSASIFKCECEPGFLQVRSADGTSFRCDPNQCDITAAAQTYIGGDFSTCEGHRTGDECVAQCLDGYTMSGLPNFKCGTDGRFQTLGSTPFACTPDKCTIPRKYPAGVDFSDCNLKRTNEKCIVRCLEGYAGDNQTFTCESDHELRGTMPICDAKFCQTIPHPSTIATFVFKGVVDFTEKYDATNCNGIRTAGTCEVRCAAGYFVPATEGPSETTLECTPKGQLNGTLPKCEAAACRPVSGVEGVDFSILQDVHVGENRSVNCAPGYSQTESTIQHSLRPAASSDLTVEELGTTGEIRAVKFTFSSGIKFQVRAALSGDKGAVSISSAKDRSRFMIVSNDNVFMANEDGTFNFRKAASYFLIVEKNGYRFRSVADQSKFLRVNVINELVASSDDGSNDGKFEKETLFVFTPNLYGLPNTVESLYFCERGGMFSGIPPACTKNACNLPRYVPGIDFGDCRGKILGETCKVKCAYGYTGIASNSEGLYECHETGLFDGTLPKCVANTCSVPQWRDDLDGSDCAARTTGESCAVHCKTGYSSTALLVANRTPLADLSAAPLAAGTPGDLGCRHCGVGEYGNYPCQNDTVTSCRNWCADTPGCKYFHLYTGGEHAGKCCRLTAIPSFGARNPDVNFYALDADFLVLNADNYTIKTIDDLRGMCSQYRGMALASVDSVQKLEQIYSLLHRYDFVNLALDRGVPIAYNVEGRYYDLLNGVRDIGQVLSSANEDSTSLFFDKIAWTVSPGQLIGLGFGKNKVNSFSFGDVQAVVCERSFVCQPNGTLSGEPAICTKNRCQLPNMPSLDASDCDGKLTGETCRVSCKKFRAPYDVVYSFMGSVSAPALTHSYAQTIPTDGVTIGAIARITTNLASWDHGSLVTLGGSAEECCSGSLEVYTVSNRAVGCVEGSGLFAFGFGSACNSSDAPVFTACKFAPGIEHTVYASFKLGEASITVNERLEVHEPRAYAIERTDGAGYAISYLTGCHIEEVNGLEATLKHVKVWNKEDSALLTCDANGRFRGTIPCLTDDTCPVPPVPLSVDTSPCTDLHPDGKCNVSCHDSIPSTDIAFSSEASYNGPSALIGSLPRLPHDYPTILSFSARVSTNVKAPWEFKSLLLVGGTTENCCAGSLYVFTRSDSLAGCIEGSGKYAIGFGVQCDALNSESPIFTKCIYSQGTSYNVRVTYDQNNLATISVNGQQAAKGIRVFNYMKTDEKGFAITALNGCHKIQHEETEGDIADIMVFSVSSSYELTCLPNGELGGDMPSCLDRVCAPPSQEGKPAVDFSKCYNKRSGETCVAKCNLGYSEDGRNTNDRRMDSLLWLESEEVVEGLGGSSVWLDHRGKSFGAGIVVSPVNAHFDPAQSGLRLQGNDSRVEIFGVDIREQSKKDVTLELWVKVSTTSATAGVLFGNGGPSRSIRWAGPVLLPPLKGDWLHLVGVFSAGQRTRIYKNGIEAILDADDDAARQAGADFIAIGPWSNSGLSFDGWVANLRVYTSALTAEDVKGLYLAERSVKPRSVSADVRHGALVWLQASDIRGGSGSWSDHRGALYTQFNAKAYKTYFDSVESALRFKPESGAYARVESFGAFGQSYDSFTFELWAKFASNNGVLVGFATATGDVAFDRAITLQNATNSIVLGSVNGSDGQTNTKGQVVIGKWTHIVGVTQRSTGSAGPITSALYIDGFRFAKDELAKDIASVFTDIVVGRPATGGFDGWLATLRVYPRALEEVEVKDLYFLSDPVMTSPIAKSIINSAVIYLEGRDVVYTPLDAQTLATYTNQGLAKVPLRDRRRMKLLWKDHRGEQNPCAGTPTLQYDRILGGVRLDKAHPYSSLWCDPDSGTTIAPLNGEISYELWVKVNSYSFAEDRVVIGNGVRDVKLSGKLGLVAEGNDLDASGLIGQPATGQWMHLVAVWRTNGPSYLFKNGIPFKVDAKVTEKERNYLLLGHGVLPADAWVSTVRVYRYALTHADVKSLLSYGHYASSMGTTSRDSVPDVRTCQGGKMSITCMTGRFIHIQSATYGRTDATQCTGSDENVHTICRTPNVLSAVMKACEGKVACSIAIGNGTFGNHCEHTTSYLDVDYECKSARSPNLPNPTDVRQDALLWLEAGDVSNVNNATLRWVDHRGSSFSRDWDIQVGTNLGFDSANDGIRVRAGECKENNVFVKGLSIDGSSSLQYVSLEMWVKTTSNRISGFMARGSKCPKTEVDINTGLGLAFDRSPFDGNRWNHYVAVWKGQSVSYFLNGAAIRGNYPAIQRGPAAPKAADAFLTLGGQASEAYWISTVRVYGRALDQRDVLNLYYNGRSAGPWMAQEDPSAETFKCNTEGDFVGAMPTCVANACSQPYPIPGVDFSDCLGKRTGDSCAVKCAAGYEGQITRFSAAPVQMCQTFATYDKLVGRKTLQQCKQACIDGLLGCKEGCEFASPKKRLACNAISYDAASEECTLFNECEFSVGSSSDPREFYSVVASPSSQYSCGVFGQFLGTPPTCKAVLTSETLGGLSQTCEGKFADLKCANGQVILIKTASFGRTSARVCPGEQAKEDVVCRADRAMDIVKAACDGKESCSVFSGVTTFGEPCKGISKYLEVNYECRDPNAPAPDAEQELLAKAK